MEITQPALTPALTLALSGTPDPWSPARRLAEAPASYLSDSELLEVLLATHMPPDAAVLASRRLLNLTGGVYGLAGMSIAELREAAGLTRPAACALIGALALGSRAVTPPMRKSARLLSAAAVARQFREVFAGLKQEHFHALLLDTKMRLLKDALITVGLVDRTQIHPREVFRQAVRESASSIILLHNHPSGDPTPSAPDIEATNTLTEAGKIIGIQVVDHVIIGTPSPSFPQGYLSLREEKMMKAA